MKTSTLSDEEGYQRKGKTKLQKETSISESENHVKLSKTFSNLHKAVKDKLIVWNCCFFPHLQTIDCCNSCEVDVQSNLGL
jgi:hypothetical protein